MRYEVTPLSEDLHVLPSLYYDFVYMWFAFQMGVQIAEQSVLAKRKIKRAHRRLGNTDGGVSIISLLFSQIVKHLQQGKYMLIVFNGLFCTYFVLAIIGKYWRLIKMKNSFTSLTK